MLLVSLIFASHHAGSQGVLTEHFGVESRIAYTANRHGDLYAEPPPKARAIQGPATVVRALSTGTDEAGWHRSWQHRSGDQSCGRRLYKASWSLQARPPAKHCSWRMRLFQWWLLANQWDFVATPTSCIISGRVVIKSSLCSVIIAQNAIGPCPLVVIIEWGEVGYSRPYRPVSRIDRQS